jgi:hypothetical protein
MIYGTAFRATFAVYGNSSLRYLTLLFNAAVRVASFRLGKLSIPAYVHCAVGGKTRYNELELGLLERLLI